GERVAVRVTRELRPRLRGVINATGIVLHTNLGRAPIAAEAAQAAHDAALGYLNLELDLETGKRSSRQVAVREWICRLTGGPSAARSCARSAPRTSRAWPTTSAPSGRTPARSCASMRATTGSAASRKRCR